MTKRGHLQAALAAVALCVPIAGCGDDDVGDPIPPGKAADLESQLDAVRDAVDQDLCEDAAQGVEDARATVDTLDDEGVGSDVQDALGDGVDNLGSLVSQDCEEEEVETTPDTTPETMPETVPPPTETVPPPTETVPPPEEEPEPEEEDEVDEEGGGGQFDPNALPPGQENKLEDDG